MIEPSFKKYRVASMSKKSQRQGIYDTYRNLLIKAGISPDIFPDEDVRINDQKLLKLQDANKHMILLGDLNYYAEQALKCTSKSTLSATHSVFTTEARRYWCIQSGIEPRIETNQGKGRGTTKGKTAKTFGMNSVITLEQAVKMFCYLIRFKIMPESPISLEEFQDLGIAALLNFLEYTDSQELYLLKESKLGKFLRAA